jgi:hypothetical protein
MSNQEIVTVFFTISAFIALWVVTKSISKLRNHTEDTPASDRWESYTKIGLSIIILILAAHNWWKN